MNRMIGRVVRVLKDVWARICSSWFVAKFDAPRWRNPGQTLAIESRRITRIRVPQVETIWATLAAPPTSTTTAMSLPPTSANSSATGTLCNAGFSGA